MEKTAVALSRSLFEALPAVQAVEPEDAVVAWIVYEIGTQSVGGG